MFHLRRWRILEDHAFSQDEWPLIDFYVASCVSALKVNGPMAARADGGWCLLVSLR